MLIPQRLKAAKHPPPTWPLPHRRQRVPLADHAATHRHPCRANHHAPTSRHESSRQRQHNDPLPFAEPHLALSPLWRPQPLHIPKRHEFAFPRRVLHIASPHANEVVSFVQTASTTLTPVK